MSTDTTRAVINPIVSIDREVYEHLSPLHRAAADLMVSHGTCKIAGEAPACHKNFPTGGIK
jgi:hypothetical protein